MAIAEEEYIEKLKEKSENENTSRKIKAPSTARKSVFKKLANERNFQANLKEYNSDVLDQTLSPFYA